MTRYDEALAIMTGRFTQDNLIAIATMEAGRPDVRFVNAYYENGAFYAITYALSDKIQQIEQTPELALCTMWFNGHGIGENLGYILLDEHAAILKKLRAAFATWYENGHTNEADPNTCLLRIRLTDGVLLDDGTRYEIDFENHTA